MWEVGSYAGNRTGCEDLRAAAKKGWGYLGGKKLHLKQRPHRRPHVPIEYFLGFSLAGLKIQLCPQLELI